MNAEPESWITRAEAARRWAVSPQMVGRYCQQGMPSRTIDKRLPWPKADRWRSMFVSSSASGNWRFRQRQKEQQQAGLH
jgi:hypothetical protein